LEEYDVADGAMRRVYDYLYNQILTGERPLGSPISESEVGEALGVSRSPVREALKIMETQKLTTHYPSRGTFVTNITHRDLEEILDLRIMFELNSIGSACKYMDMALVKELEAGILSLNREASREVFYLTNNRLHRAIIEYGGNKRLKNFYEMLSAQFDIINRIFSCEPEIPENFRTSKEKHLSIVRAIKKRDREEAEVLLRKHLLEVKEKTLQKYSILQR
jgi:DNA-binding GntR family transcriptional regulator